MIESIGAGNTEENVEEEKMVLEIGLVIIVPIVATQFHVYAT